MADAYDGIGEQVIAKAIAERALELYGGNPNFSVFDAVPSYYRLLGDDVGYRDALEYGWSLLRNHWSHPDFSEGPKAFGEKRDPEWNPNPNARGEGGS